MILHTNNAKQQGSPATRLLSIGPLPPPVNGRAVVTKEFIESCESHGLYFDKLNLEPTAGKFHSPLVRRFFRVVALVPCLFQFGRLLRQKRHQWIYLPISGGFGQLLELPFILLARIYGVRLLIHHHSFAYLRNKSFMTMLALKVAGDRTTLNIALGTRMRDLLQNNYGCSDIEVLSNAAFVESNASRVQRISPLVLGYLGNISAEKGIFVFIDLLLRLSERGVSFEAKIAGSSNNVTMNRVRSLLNELANVELLGAIYDSTKEAFYNSIDFFLLPSSYANEAQPLVLLEALGHGVICVATDIGDIPEMLNYDNKQFSVPITDFIDRSERIINHFLLDPCAAEEMKVRAFTRFCKLKEAAKGDLDRIVLRLYSQD